MRFKQSEVYEKVSDMFFPGVFRRVGPTEESGRCREVEKRVNVHWIYELSVVVESWSLVEESIVMLLWILDSISTKKKIFKRCSDTSRLVKGYLLSRRFLGVFANLTKHERKTDQKTTYYSG